MAPGSHDPTNQDEANLRSSVQDLVDAMNAVPDYHGPDAQILRTLRVISARLNPCPSVTIRIRITPDMCNLGDKMHGGAAATTFDLCTSLALALVCKAGIWETLGVTRTLNVTCLEPVAMGKEVDVISDIVKVSSRLAHMRAIMQRTTRPTTQFMHPGQPSNSTGQPDAANLQPVALCDHGKVNVLRARTEHSSLATRTKL